MLWSIITVLLIAGDHKSQKKAAFQYFKSDDFGILSFLLLCDNFQFGKDDILIVKIRYVQYILQIIIALHWSSQVIWNIGWIFNVTTKISFYNIKVYKLNAIQS